jgi:tRNA1(Val) A37 N6-methylase TrmN6
MNKFLKPDERVDDLQCKGLRIIQNPEWFCFGIDAVILSNFVNVKKNASVVDLGCGNGIISILLAGKTQASSIVGIEIQPEVAELAARSILLNRLEDRVKIIQGDIKDAPTFLGLSSVDVVVTNPPYRTNGCGLVNPDSTKAIARHEILCSLEEVITSSKSILSPGGKLFMVHRPDRLVDIICNLRKHDLEPKRLRFVHPYIDKAPNLVLIEASRGGNAHMKVEKPLVIYKSQNEYTEEIKQCQELYT